MVKYRTAEKSVVILHEEISQMEIDSINVIIGKMPKEDYSKRYRVPVPMITDYLNEYVTIFCYSKNLYEILSKVHLSQLTMYTDLYEERDQYLRECMDNLLKKYFTYNFTEEELKVFYEELPKYDKNYIISRENQNFQAHYIKYYIPLERFSTEAEKLLIDIKLGIADNKETQEKFDMCFSGYLWDIKRSYQILKEIEKNTQEVFDKNKTVPGNTYMLAIHYIVTHFGKLSSNERQLITAYITGEMEDHEEYVPA